MFSFGSLGVGFVFQLVTSLFGFIKGKSADGILGDIASILQKRADAATEKYKSDNELTTAVAVKELEAHIEIEKQKAAIRIAEGKWSPWVVATIVGFMFPFAWHTWQVVLDSSRWVPDLCWAWWFPYPCITKHTVGSWNVAVLPGAFENTEHAVIQSLFIGAGAALATVATIKAIKR